MNDLAITSIAAREILDCRGLPTVQVDVVVNDRFTGRADVPAGRSTGRHEAKEVRDGGRRFGGFGVRTAVKNVHEHIAPVLQGRSAASQRQVDMWLREIDGTPDKSALGANAVLGVSLAVARAVAMARGVPLYRALSLNASVLPVPQVNLINGGKHASNDLDFQEFTIMPVGAANILEALQISTEVNLVLGELLLKRFGKVALNTGDEGGYAPPMSDPEDALGLLHQAVEKAGHSKAVVYGLDCAATHLYEAKTNTYRLMGKAMKRDELVGYYEKLCRDYGVVSIEDPLQEDDFPGFAEVTKRLGVQIVGDDLFVTNTGRLKEGIEMGAANALLFKVNQIGTLTEALDAAALARSAGYSVVVSERSGETEDPLIADLVVGLDAGQIKTGAPVRGERTAKYNRLLKIEEELGGTSVYAGLEYRNPARLSGRA